MDRLVIETLKEVQPDRRCYRMVGGVLVERTVGDVLPTLTTNKQQVSLVVPMNGDGGFFLACKDCGGRFDGSFPACAYFLFVCGDQLVTYLVELLADSNLCKR